MDKTLFKSLIGIVGLVALLGCQAKAPQENPPEEPVAEETPILEESFESGDTGDLPTEIGEEPAAAEEPPPDDSQ